MGVGGDELTTVHVELEVDPSKLAAGADAPVALASASPTTATLQSLALSAPTLSGGSSVQAVQSDLGSVQEAQDRATMDTILDLQAGSLVAGLADGFLRSAPTAGAAADANVLDASPTPAAPPLSVLTMEDAASAIERLDAAIAALSSVRAEVGAATTVLHHQYQLQSTLEITHDITRSRIEDADMPPEALRLAMAKFTEQVRNQLMPQLMTAHRFTVDSLLGSMTLTGRNRR